MDQYSNSIGRQLANLGDGFWRWLKTCVAALVDDIAGSATETSPPRTMIVVSEAQTEIYGPFRKGVRDLRFRLGSSPAEIAAQLRTKLRGRAARSVLLRIDSGKAVVKKVTLPATALEVLPAIVRNKVESLAPWPLSEVMWGYRVSDTAQSGQVGVDVAIVSRKSADVLLSAVHNAGVKVIQLDVGDRSDDPHGIQIDFLGPARAKRARRLVTSVMSAAAIAALMAGTYGLYLALSLQSELASVDRRARLLEEKLLGGGTAKVSAKLSEANKLYQRRKESLPVVAMLNSLTKAVPDGTWLNGIDYGGGQLTITGRGNGIAGVIESLEKSDTFANVNFASATQRDASLQADIFSISADIQANGGPQ